MVMRPEGLSPFERNGAIAERGSFGAARDDANLQHRVRLIQLLIVAGWPRTGWYRDNASRILPGCRLS